MVERKANPRILIVEDDPVQAMKVEALLQSDGCDVRVAENARKALAMIGEYPPDIIVSDVLMPGMDGYEMCKRIRSDENLKNVGVVLLTCLSEPLDVMRGLEVGADNFLPKPYESSRLIEMVREMHEARTVSDSSGHRVRFQGKTFAINSTRTQILNFFLTLYEDALRKNEEIVRTQKELQYVNDNLAKLVGERTADLSREVESRKKAEEQSRERAQLLDKAQDAILVTDLEGRIKYANRSAKQLYGWSETEMIGRDISLLIYDETRPFPVESTTAVCEMGEWVGELHQVTKAGKDVRVMSSWTLVRDEQQRPRSILIISTNVAGKRTSSAA